MRTRSQQYYRYSGGVVLRPPHTREVAGSNPTDKEQKFVCFCFMIFLPLFLILFSAYKIDFYLTVVRMKRISRSREGTPILPISLFSSLENHILSLFSSGVSVF